LKVVIIGNSAAGLSAAETVRRFSADAEITIISYESHQSYLRCMITDVLAGTKDLSDIHYKTSDFYQKYNVKLLKGTRATGISPDDKKVSLEDGQEVFYDFLVVATGAAHTPLGIEGEELEGIFPFRTYDQAAAAGKAAETNHEAVVIGAGLVGLDAAMALIKKGLQVTVVETAPHLLINQLDEQSAALVEKELSEMGIKFIFRAKPESFVCRFGNNLLASVLLDNGHEIPAGMAIVSAGVRPCIDLVKKAGGKVGAGIEVDDLLATSIHHVYAAGDCIEIKDAVSGDVIPSALWPLAVEQGRFVAYNILGKDRPYPLPLVRMNATQFGKIPIISAGIIGDSSELLTHEDPVNQTHRRLFFKDDFLVGYILIGDVEGAGIYTELVKKRWPVGQLKHKLLKGTISSVELMKLR